MEVTSKVRYTTILKKYPSFRDEALKTCWRWLEGRQEDDNAEGFWRVHDKIYNLNGFIRNHPGGREWIELTKGTDITEAFESYHILPKASMLLGKFYVKDADQPRNYRLTYKEDGFYRTLKNRVAAKLPSLDKSDLSKSKFYLDGIVCGFFLASIMAVKAEWIFSRIFYILIASQCVGWMNAAAHNFAHQRNNWRMYAANFVLVGWRDWRVFHGLSHHLYPNSYTDLEVAAYEPWLRWLPVQSRSTEGILVSFLMTPLAYLTLFHLTWFYRFMGLFYAKTKTFYWDELLTLLPPVMMFLAGNPTFSLINILTIITIWTLIILLGSFLYSLTAVNAGHHGSKNVHQGDEFRDLDFGVYQMAATVDRIETNYSLAVSLTHFGDHTLHHLFPSLDHALLPQLREIFKATCKEFDVEFRKCTMLHAAIEQFKQLSRTKLIRLEEINNNEKVTVRY